MGIVLAIFIVLVLFILISAAYGGYRAAIWVPMFGRDVPRAMDVARIQPGDVFLDLGFGDGRVLEAAAARGATAIGYEVSMIPFCLAWMRKLRSPYRKQIKLRFGDFWFADLSAATIVHAYLMKEIYLKLREKIERECGAGTRVVLYVWPMEGWKEEEVSVEEGKPKVWGYVV